MERLEQIILEIINEIELLNNPDLIALLLTMGLMTFLFGKAFYDENQKIAKERIYIKKCVENYIEENKDRFFKNKDNLENGTNNLSNNNNGDVPIQNNSNNIENNTEITLENKNNNISTSEAADTENLNNSMSTPSDSINTDSKGILGIIIDFIIKFFDL